MPLSNREPWRYFDANDEPTAMLALRARMGTSYATVPDDATLADILDRSVRFVERATQRFFVRRDGEIKLRGAGEPRQSLPFPVISVDQGATGVTSVTIDDDTDPIDVEEYVVNDGAWEGPEDPRTDPFIEWAVSGFGSFVSRPPEIATSRRRFAYGVGNIAVSASWGFVEPDGTTPIMILHMLARLCILNSAPNDDLCAVDDKKRGALLSESTSGRSYQMALHAVSSGLTLDREIDLILREYKRPPEVYISRPPARRGRTRYRE